MSNPKTPAAGRGRKRNGNLADLDAENQAEAGTSSGVGQESSNPSASTSQPESNDQSNNRGANNRTDSNTSSSGQNTNNRRGDTSSESSGGSDSSSDGSQTDEGLDTEAKSKAKARSEGFIGFEGNRLITANDRCAFRKVKKHLQAVGSLFRDTDKGGKDTFNEFVALSKEHMDFVKEVIKEIRIVPKSNPLRAETLAKLRELNEAMEDLYICIDPRDSGTNKIL